MRLPGRGKSCLHRVRESPLSRLFLELECYTDETYYNLHWTSKRMSGLYLAAVPGYRRAALKHARLPLTVQGQGV